MAKNTVYEWDSVAANNTDIAGINIQGSAAVSNFDNALRTVMAQVKSGVPIAQVQSITATVAANALTLGWTPQHIMSFRNPTLATGTPVFATVASALSLVVPSGATLGTTNAQQSVLAIVLLYNGGTPALGVINTSGGVILDETGLISTTAISAGSSSSSTVYSTSAITSSPYTVVGFVTSTQATAGTWASAPTIIQGAGREALKRAIPVQSMVRVNTANGHGSLATSIRRFTTTLTTTPDVTYSDSATQGAVFIINTSGNYAISYMDFFSSAAEMGVSLNSTQLTTSIFSITAADRIAHATTAANGSTATAAVTMYLPAGSILRPHTAGAAGGGTQAQFTITRVS